LAASSPDRIKVLKWYANQYIGEEFGGVLLDNPPMDGHKESRAFLGARVYEKPDGLYFEHVRCPDDVAESFWRDIKDRT
jgi:hypothetical protein